MDVILDANAILADPRMQGNYFSELFAYLRRTGSRLVVPTIVFKEASARYPEELTRHLRRAISDWSNARHFCIQDVPKLQEVDVRQELRSFKRRLCKPAKAVKVLLYRKMSEAHIREVLRRGIRRIPPASPAGEELRDVALWLVALQFAKETHQPLALITKDGGFTNDSKDGLHPRLVEECQRAQVKLHFYRELRDFVVGNALAQEAIDEAWFFSYVPRDRAKDVAIAMLLQLTANRGQVQAAEVSKLEFSSGQKYKAGENSYFVESSLAGEARITILENTWTTFVNLGPNFPSQPNLAIVGTTEMFGLDPINYNALIGTPTISGSLAGVNLAPSQSVVIRDVTYTPPTVERLYRCRFVLQLTARVVKEKLEAVEPEGIQIEELAAIEPERPGPVERRRPLPSRRKK